MAPGKRWSARMRFFEEHTFVNEHADAIALGEAVDSVIVTDMQPENILGTNIRRLQMSKKKSAGVEIQHDLPNLCLTETENVSDHINMSKGDENVTVLGNLSPFGQAYYQKSKQGAIIHYKDFGDDTLECAYCNAYYWEDEKTTRVYTGCCQQCQVKLPTPNPTPSFLEHLLNPKNGPKSILFQENLFSTLSKTSVYSISDVNYLEGVRRMFSQDLRPRKFTSLD